MRLAGAILLLTGGVGVGLSAVRRLERRVTALRSLVGALELLERELDFRLPPMKELITETARRSAEPAARFLRVCAENMDRLEGRPLSRLWQQTAREELPALKPCDLEALCSVGAVLGRYDAESQRSVLSAARERLESYLTQALDERRRQGRVYTTLGAAAGAFLVILLL